MRPRLFMGRREGLPRLAESAIGHGEEAGPDEWADLFVPEGGRVPGAAAEKLEAGEVVLLGAVSLFLHTIVAFLQQELTRRTACTLGT